MEYSMCFPASLQAADQARRAEALGFDAIGFYDSPALEADVWIVLAQAAQATSRIRIGTEVLIPHLRHPMAQAGAIATIEQIAPGRLYVGIGTGFTGRMAMGQRPLTWAYVARFIEDVKALLAGRDAVIDGAVTRMLHAPGLAAPRPIATPFLVAANGPKGIGIARAVGDGLIYGGDHGGTPSGFSMLQMTVGGVLLDAGEEATAPRVLERAKMLMALYYHLAYDSYANPPLPVGTLPLGKEWLAAIEAFPNAERHLHVHEGHMVELSAHDRAVIERHPDVLEQFARAVAMRPEELPARVAQLAALGVTRIGCGLAFDDWERDMERFAAALGL